MSQHILILSPNYPPEQGACASRIRFMSQGLTKAGFTVEVLTAMPNYPKGKIFEGYRNRLFIIEMDENVIVNRYLSYPSHSPKLLPRIFGMITLSLAVLLRLFSTQKNKPHLIIAQSPPLLLGVSAYLLAKWYKADLVMNVSDLWPRALLDLGAIRKGVLYKSALWVEKFLYKNAKLCIGQSGEILQYIHQVSPATPTFLYRTGVDCQLFLPKEVQERTANAPLKIVYAGLLGAAQGVLSICKNINFKELNAELHIYGEGYERQTLHDFLEKNKELGIFLHPAVVQQEIPAILQAHDIALVTQKKVVFGTVPSKIYEAMAVGLPILFCGGGEGADIVSSNELGLISTPYNFEELESNILKMSKLSKEEMEKIKHRGNALAQKEFDRNCLIKNLIKGLEKLN